MDRDIERRRAQFELERQLRQRILQSPTESRQAVIASAYAELFSKFPDHEVFHANTEDRRRKGRLRAGMVIPLSRPGNAVLEVGCGRGDVLLELARLGHKCFGIEPSGHMLSICANQKAVTVAFGTADRLEFADGSFDLVFSQEVLEHLHPDDVPVHFSEAFRVLQPGGILAVETPNRDTGPQDVSRGFVAVAEGLHLKEWSVPELIQQFRQAGFVKIRGVLVTPFLARRWAFLHRGSWVPATVKYVQSVLLAMLPGMRLRTVVGKVIRLDDLFLFGQKPRD